MKKKQDLLLLALIAACLVAVFAVALLDTAEAARPVKPQGGKCPSGYDYSPKTGMCIPIKVAVG